MISASALRRPTPPGVRLDRGPVRRLQSGTSRALVIAFWSLLPRDPECHIRLVVRSLYMQDGCRLYELEIRTCAAFVTRCGYGRFYLVVNQPSNSHHPLYLCVSVCVCVCVCVRACVCVLLWQVFNIAAHLGN